MDAEEILNLLAHPRFISLESVPGGWKIHYTGDKCQPWIEGGLLDTLLQRFAEILARDEETVEA